MKILELFSTSKLSHYKKGEAIIRADEAVDDVYYIVKGFVRMYSITDSGDEKILVMNLPGDMFPLIPILGNIENRWYYEAMADTDVFKIAKSQFLDHIKLNPDTLFEVVRQMADFLRILTTRIDILDSLKAKERIISELIFLVEDFGEKQPEGILINFPVTHRDIAGRNSLTRETVSRELSKLEKKRVISYRGKLLLVKDVKKLKEELENTDD